MTFRVCLTLFVAFTSTFSFTRAGWVPPSPALNSAVPIADLLGSNAAVALLVALDPAASAATFTYSLVASPAALALFALSPTGRLTVAPGAVLTSVWGAAPANVSGAPFTLAVIAAPASGGGVPPAALTFSVVVKPSYLPAPCRPIRAGWAQIDPYPGLNSDPIPSAVPASYTYNDWTKTAAYQPAGSSFCYFRLEAFATAYAMTTDTGYAAHACGSVADGAGIAAVGSIAEATFAITSQCSLNPLPSYFAGISLGLNTWQDQNYNGAGGWVQGGSYSHGGIRDANGALPYAWQFYRVARDSAWLRSAAAASFWAPGHPVDTTAGSSMQWVVTNSFGQLTTVNWGSQGTFAPCCMFPARTTPLLARAPRLGPAFSPDASGAAWGWTVSSGTAAGANVANVSALFSDGDDAGTPAGIFTLFLVSATPSLAAFNASFSLTSLGVLVVSAPLGSLVNTSALPGSAAVAYTFTVIAVDGLGLTSAPVIFNVTVRLALSPDAVATNSAPTWLALAGGTLVVPADAPLGARFPLSTAVDSDANAVPPPSSPAFSALTYSLRSGTLPVGLALDAASGALLVTGPLSVGSVGSISLRVIDGLGFSAAGAPAWVVSVSSVVVADGAASGVGGGACPAGFTAAPGVSPPLCLARALPPTSSVGVSGWDAASPRVCGALGSAAVVASLTRAELVSAAAGVCGGGTWVAGRAALSPEATADVKATSGAGESPSDSVARAAAAASWTRYAAWNPLTRVPFGAPGDIAPSSVFDFSRPGTLTGSRVADALGAGDAVVAGAGRGIDVEEERGATVARGGASIVDALSAATAPGSPLAVRLQIRALPNDSALAGLTDGARVSAWENFVAPTTPFPDSAPFYRSKAGPFGMPTLEFRGTNTCGNPTAGQWMTRAVPTTMAMRSNGGLTVAVIAKLTPWTGSYERVFDASTNGAMGVYTNAFLLERFSSTDVLALNRQGSSGTNSAFAADGQLSFASKEQGAQRSLRGDTGDFAFIVFVTSANTTSSVTNVYSNGVFVSRSTSVNDNAYSSTDTLADRVFPSANQTAGLYPFQLGRSHWVADHLLTGSISALLIWDRPLPPDQLATLHDAMLPRSAGRVPAPFAHFDGGYSFMQLPASTTFSTLEMWVRLASPDAQRTALGGAPGTAPAPGGAWEGPVLWDARNPSAPANLSRSVFTTSLTLVGSWGAFSTFAQDFDPVVDNATTINVGGRLYYLVGSGVDRPGGDAVSASGNNGATVSGASGCAMLCDVASDCRAFAVTTRALQGAPGTGPVRCYVKGALSPNSNPLFTTDVYATAELASGWSALNAVGAALFVDGAPAPLTRQSAFAYDDAWHHLVFTLPFAITDDLVLFARSQKGGWAFGPPGQAEGAGASWGERFGLTVDVGEVRLYPSTLAPSDVAARYAEGASRWQAPAARGAAAPGAAAAAAAAASAAILGPLPSFALPSSTTFATAATPLPSPSLWYDFTTAATLRNAGMLSDCAPSRANTTLARALGATFTPARAAPAMTASGFLSLAGGSTSGIAVLSAPPNFSVLDFTARFAISNAGATFPPLVPSGAYSIRASKPPDGTAYMVYPTYNADPAYSPLNIQEIAVFGPPGSATFTRSRTLGQPTTMNSLYSSTYPPQYMGDGLVITTSGFYHGAAGGAPGTMAYPTQATTIGVAGYEPIGRIEYTPRVSCCVARSCNVLIEIFLTKSPNVTVWSTRLSADPNAFNLTGAPSGLGSLGVFTQVLNVPQSVFSLYSATGPTLLDARGAPPASTTAAWAPAFFAPRPAGAGTAALAASWRPGFENATLFVDGVSKGTAWASGDLFLYDGLWHHFALSLPTVLAPPAALRLFGRSLGEWDAPNIAWANGADPLTGNATYSSAGLSVDVLDVRFYAEPLPVSAIALRAAASAQATGALVVALDATPVLSVSTFVYNSSVTGTVPYKVPPGVRQLRVRLWGAGGGGGGGSAVPAYRHPGGGGAFVRGVIDVTPGETLQLVLGRGGTQLDTTPSINISRAPQADWAGGGGGAALGGNSMSTLFATDSPSRAGSGGGRTGIRRGAVEIVTAGGGGGGYGWSDFSGGGAGGVFRGFCGDNVLLTGGATVTTSSRQATTPLSSILDVANLMAAGCGGGQTAGGAALPGMHPIGGMTTPGTQWAGGSGNPFYFGAGGGGGAWGGGGGENAGGGGGSSNVLNLRDWAGSADGWLVEPGGVRDPYYLPGVGVGGQSQAGASPSPYNSHMTFLWSSPATPFVGNNAPSTGTAAVGTGGPGAIVIEALGAASVVTSGPTASAASLAAQTLGATTAAARAAPPLPLSTALWPLASVADSTLALWLDSATLKSLPAGAAVSGWPNRAIGSALGPVATSLAQAPVLRSAALNGWPVLTFSAASMSQLVLDAGVALPRVARLPIHFPWSYLVVARMSGTNFGRIVSQAGSQDTNTATSSNWGGPWRGGFQGTIFSSANAPYAAMDSVTGAPARPASQPNGTVGTYADTLWHVYAATFHGNNSVSAWADGVLLGRYLWNGRGAPPFGVPDGVVLNGPGKASSAASADWSDCEVAELMMWSARALSDVDVAGLHAYIRQKYALALNGAGMLDATDSPSRAPPSPPRAPVPAPRAPAAACLALPNPLADAAAGGSGGLVPTACETIAPAVCCAAPATVASRVPNTAPVWTAVFSADASVDATASAAAGGGVLALTVPHLAAVGVQLAVFAASDVDAGAAGAVAYSITSAGAGAGALTLAVNVATGVATLSVGASLVSFVGSTLTVSVIATDGGGAFVTVSVAVSVVLSFARPLYVAPEFIRVARPGADRVSVAEIYAFTPGGANVAVGSLVTSGDTHDAGEFWAALPSFMAANGFVGDYADTWTGGDVISETNATAGLPPDSYQPFIELALGAPTELSSVVVALRADCTLAVTGAPACLADLGGVVVTAQARNASGGTGARAVLASAAGPVLGSDFLNGSYALTGPVIVLSLPLLSPPAFGAAVIDTAPVVNTPNASVIVTDATVLGAAVLAPSAIATDADPPSLAAGTLRFASLVVVRGPAIFTVNSGGALALNGSVLGALAGGWSSAALTLTVADGLGLAAPTTVSVTVTITSTFLATGYVCPAGWTRPPSSQRCFRMLSASGGGATHPAALNAMCAAAAPGATLAAITSDAEAAFVLDAGCGWPGGRAALVATPAGAGAGAVYAIGLNASAAAPGALTPGAPLGSGWALAEGGGASGAAWLVASTAAGGAVSRWANGAPTDSGATTYCTVAHTAMPTMRTAACTVGATTALACCSLIAPKVVALWPNTPPAATTPASFSIAIPAGASAGGARVSLFAAVDADAATIIGSVPAATVAWNVSLPTELGPFLSASGGNTSGEFVVAASGFPAGTVGRWWAVTGTPVDGAGAVGATVVANVSIVPSASGGAALSAGPGKSSAAVGCPTGWQRGGAGSSRCYAALPGVLADARGGNSVCAAAQPGATGAGLPSIAEVASIARICGAGGVGSPWLAGVPPLDDDAAPADEAATAASDVDGVDAAALAFALTAAAPAAPIDVAAVLSATNPTLVGWWQLPVSSVARDGASVLRLANLASGGASLNFVATSAATAPVGVIADSPSPSFAYARFGATKKLTLASTFAPSGGVTIALVARALRGGGGTTLFDVSPSSANSPFFMGPAGDLLGLFSLGEDFLVNATDGRRDVGTNDEGWHLYTLSLSGALGGGVFTSASAFVDGALVATAMASGSPNGPIGKLCLGPACGAVGVPVGVVPVPAVPSPMPAAAVGAPAVSPQVDVGELVVFAGLPDGGGLTPRVQAAVEAQLLARWRITPAAGGGGGGGWVPRSAPRGRCTFVNAVSGAIGFDDCSAPRPVCCALPRAGVVERVTAPLWVGAAATAVAATAPGTVPTLNATVPSTAPLGIVAIDVDGVSNSARWPRSTVFSVLGGAAAALPFAINASSCAVTVSGDLSALAGGSRFFTVSLTNGDGVPPAGASFINVSISVVFAFVVTCPLPTAARVRFIFAPNSNGVPVGVREVTVTGASGVIPAANLLPVQGPSMVQGWWSYGTQSSFTGASSLSALTDGVFGSYAGPILTTFTNINSAAGARYTDVGIANSSNVYVPVRSASMHLAMTNASLGTVGAFPPSGSWIQLWTANSGAVTAQTAGSTLSSWTKGGADVGHSFNFSADFSMVACAPLTLALLHASDPMLTLATPTGTAWHIADSAPVLAMPVWAAVGGPTPIVAAAAGAPVYGVAGLAVPGAPLTLTNGGAALSFTATDADPGLAGKLTMNASGVGAADFDFITTTGAGGVTTFTLVATVQFALARQSVYALTLVAVDGMLLKSNAVSVVFSVGRSYLANAAANAWAADAPPQLVFDLSAPNNALSIVENAPVGTNLSVLLKAWDADPPVLPAGTIVSLSVAVTGFIAAGGTTVQPVSAFAPRVGGAHPCGTAPCVAARAAFVGTVVGLDAFGFWSLRLTFSGGALNAEAVSAWVITMTLTDGLGLNQTTAGVPITILNANDPVSWNASSAMAVVSAGAAAGTVFGNLTPTAAAGPPTPTLISLIVDEDVSQQYAFTLSGVIMSAGAAAYYAAAPGGAATYGASLFAVSASGGVLAVTAPLNYNGALLPAALPGFWFALTVTVGDAPLLGAGDAPSSASLIVNVTVAEANVSPVGAVAARATIVSTAAPGTRALPANYAAVATDANSPGTPWSNITYALAPTSARPSDAVSWRVDALTGGIVYAGGAALGLVNAPLSAMLFDAAAAPALTVILRATDGGGLWTDITVIVDVALAATASAAPSMSVVPSFRESQSAAASQSMTATPVSVSSSPTGTPSSSSTNIPSPSQTTTVSSSPTPTPTPTSTLSSSVTPTATRTGTGTPTASVTKGASASNSPGPTLSSTGSDSSSTTPSLSSTSTSTVSAALVSLSGTGTGSATQSGSGTATPSASRTGTSTPSGTLSSGASPSATPSAESTPSSSSTLSSSSTSTGTPSSSATMSTTATATPSSTVSPGSTTSASTTSTTSPSQSASGTGSPTASASATPTPTSSTTVSASPTSTPSPSTTNTAAASGATRSTGGSSTSSAASFDSVDSPSPSVSACSGSLCGGGAAGGSSATTLTGAAAVASPTGLGIVGFAAGSIIIVLVVAFVYTRKAYKAMIAAEIALALERERRGAKLGAPAPPPGRPPAWSLESWRRRAESENDPRPLDKKQRAASSANEWTVQNPLKSKKKVLSNDALAAGC